MISGEQFFRECCDMANKFRTCQDGPFIFAGWLFGVTRPNQEEINYIQSTKDRYYDAVLRWQAMNNTQEHLANSMDFLLTAPGSEKLIWLWPKPKTEPYAELPQEKAQFFEKMYDYSVQYVVSMCYHNDYKPIIHNWLIVGRWHEPEKPPDADADEEMALKILMAIKSNDNSAQAI